jgi:hypothetical protein
MAREVSVVGLDIDHRPGYGFEQFSAQGTNHAVGRGESQFLSSLPFQI